MTKLPPYIASLEGHFRWSFLGRMYSHTSCPTILLALQQAGPHLAAVDHPGVPEDQVAGLGLHHQGARAVFLVRNWDKVSAELLLSVLLLQSSLLDVWDCSEELLRQR